MKLYIIRHGESENNVKRCYTGWADVSLTEKGFKDAEGIQNFFRNKHFDKIYTSDLKRVKQTAETVIPDCTYEETSILREINVGELEGKAFKYLLKTYGEDFKKNRANMDFSSYGGESAEEFMNRLKQFMDKMEQSEEKTVAAFSHGGFLRTL